MANDQNDIMRFKIANTLYQLSEYDTAIKSNKVLLSNYYDFLVEFPYTIRKISGNALSMIKDMPVFILYHNREISIYEFLSNCRRFERELPLLDEINGLERKFELTVLFNNYGRCTTDNAVIIESFRIFQDLHFLLATARWALMQAHRILHFRSALIWEDGWEQLWTRAAWLNNSVVLYDSCFDKLLQIVWIGTKSFGEDTGFPFGQQPLEEVEKKLDVFFQKCWRRNNLNEIPEPYRTLLVNFRASDFAKKIASYSQKLKHRGGVRYSNLFPYGNVACLGYTDQYNPANTQFSVCIDDIVQEVKEYHIILCGLIHEIYGCLMKDFNLNE